MTAKPTTVLVCNVGSSSLKLTCYNGFKTEAKTIRFSGKPDYLAAEFFDYLAQCHEAVVVLHRVVHAGEVDERPQLIDQQIKARIKHWQHLAPLHNKLVLKLVNLTAKHWLNTKQYAVFDSGIYADLPAVSQYYPLPHKLSSMWPIQRYGFHGLAHRFQWKSLQKTKEYKKVVTLQLGSGCSATAWKNGQVVDTTMGFSPLDGLVMSTRCGAIDPSILLHLIQKEGYSVDELYQLLNQQSGLMGLSGTSGQMPELLADQGSDAQQAINHFCYQVQKVIGAFYVVLGGIDAISFGGGIGENQAVIREKILAPLSCLSIKLSQAKNQQSNQGNHALHSDKSVTEIWKVQVNESEEMLNQYQLFIKEKG